MLEPPGTRTGASALDALIAFGLLLPLTGLLLLYAPPPPSLAADEAAGTHTDASLDPEIEIKAGFIYTLAKFVTWPAHAFRSQGAPLLFCVFGDDPLAASLEQHVRGKTIRDRRLSFWRPASARNLGTCHVLVIGSSQGPSMGDILRGLRGSSTITISDDPRITALGGIVRLRVNENMVQSEINQPMALRQGLRFSAHFLKLSGIVTVRSQAERD